MNTTDKVYKNLDSIIDFLMPYCSSCEDDIIVQIPNTCAKLKIEVSNLHISACITVEACYRHMTRNLYWSEYFDKSPVEYVGELRNLNYDIAKELVVNWKEIKKQILDKINIIKQECEKIDSFVI